MNLQNSFPGKNFFSPFLAEIFSPGILPFIPGGFAATGLTFDTIALSWLDNADNELGFFIERLHDDTNGCELRKHRA
ncbi:MAG: hypothetical protein WBF36_01840 [Desulfobulbales bacterium]